MLIIILKTVWEWSYVAKSKQWKEVHQVLRVREYARWTWHYTNKWQKLAWHVHSTLPPWSKAQQYHQKHLKEKKRKKQILRFKWRIRLKHKRASEVSGVHTNPCPWGCRKAEIRCVLVARWRGEPPRGGLDRSAPLWQAGDGLYLHCTNSGRRIAAPVSRFAHASGFLVPGRTAPTASNVYLEISRYNYRLCLQYSS